MLLKYLAAAASLCTLSACPGLPQGEVIGDLTQPIQAELLFTDGVSRTLLPIAAGTMLPLGPPPQGGYVAYVGARVRNAHAIVQLSGHFRDPATNNEVAYDSRTPTLHVASDGWGYPDASDNANFSNINACPNYLGFAIHGQPYTLALEISDRAGRSIRLTESIVPACQLTDPAVQADCVCTCSAGYFLGKCTGLSGDGGTR